MPGQSSTGIRDHRGWFSASPMRTWTWLFAIYLVTALPACFYGALSRAQVVGPTTEEEHREHVEKKAVASDEARTRPIGAARRATVRITRPEAPAYQLRIVDLYIPHPSRFSVRRLI
jgi:hypothetical protein